MRLSILASIGYAILFLLPAAITLFFGSRVLMPPRGAELPIWRVTAFRWGIVCAWIAMFLFLLASVDQLKTRGIELGFWLVMNLCAALFTVLGVLAGLAGSGWGRILLLIWSVLLAGGLILVAVLTIP